MKNVWSIPATYAILFVFILSIVFFVRFFMFYDAAKNIVPVGDAVFGMMLLLGAIWWAHSENII